MRALPHPHLGGQLTPRGLECIGTVRVNNGKDAVVIDTTTTWTLTLTPTEWEELLSSGVRKIDVSEWSMLQVVVDAPFLAWKASMCAQHGPGAVLLNGCTLDPDGLRDILVDCGKTAELTNMDIKGALSDLSVMEDHADIINFQGCELVEGAIEDVSKQAWAPKVTTLGLPPKVKGNLEELVRFKALTRLLMRGCEGVEGA